MLIFEPSGAKFKQTLVTFNLYRKNQSTSYRNVRPARGIVTHVSLGGKTSFAKQTEAQIDPVT